MLEEGRMFDNQKVATGGSSPPAIPDAAYRIALAISDMKDRGWCQRYFTDLMGRRCPEQALLEAYGIGSIESRSSRAAQLPVTPVILAAMRSQTSRTYTFIAHYNDEEGRTQKQVFEAFETAMRWIIDGTCGLDELHDTEDARLALNLRLAALQSAGRELATAA